MTWIIFNHPGAYLMPKMIAVGESRKYMCWEGAPSVFINCGYYVYFLMECLCVTDNLLQNNLFIILKSVGMNAVLKVHAIMHIGIGLPI